MSSHSPIRRSPLHDVLASEHPRWEVVHGMHAALRLPGDDVDAPIMLADASCLLRLGLKGPQAEAWLHARGVSVPEVNSWTRTPAGAIVARLARSEFFVEDAPGGAALARWREDLEPGPGVYPVLRQEAAIALAGERLSELLVQTCNVNFAAWAPDAPVVVMTSMVGVSVLVLWHRQGALLLYRIWCDATYGPYLCETLLGVAREEGGRMVGLAKLFPDLPGT